MNAHAAELAVMDPAGRRALIVRGGWAGHQPVETTDLFLDFLAQQGFSVQIHDVVAEVGPTPYADAALMDGIDLVIQSVSMGMITAEQVRGLRAAVAAGTGLAGWHGGIIGSFGESWEYLQLVGGVFAAHPPRLPQAAGTASPVEYPHSYTVLDHEHPITVGIDDFALTTEQYWVLSDDYSDVLASTTLEALPADEWDRAVTSPAVWTRRWGRGRVFVATPGHSVDVLAVPVVRTLVERGILWAARDRSHPSPAGATLGMVATGGIVGSEGQARA